MSEEKKKHPAGRPTKFEEWMIDDVVELGKKGYCIENIASKYDVSKQSLYNWADKNPKFFDALTRAKNHCVSHMILLAKENLANKNYNQKMWEIMMRFVHGCNDMPERAIPGFEKCKTLEEKCDMILNYTMAGKMSADECLKLVNAVCARANLKIEDIEKRVEEIQAKLLAK